MNASAKGILAIAVGVASLLVSEAQVAKAATDCLIDRDNPIIIPAHGDDTKQLAYRLSDGSIVFLGRFTIDADGAPKAYGPDDSGLDDLANAGESGNWYGLATDAPDCGPAGTPLVQGADDPAPGFYVSTTAMTNPAVHDCRKQSNYVDSSSIPYVALPPAIAKLDRNRGNLVVVEQLPGGSPQFGVQADVAPRDGLGEGSIDLAQRLGLKSDPRHGGTSKRKIVFVVLTDRMAFPANADEVNTNASAAFDKWGGQERLDACRQALLSAPR